MVRMKLSKRIGTSSSEICILALYASSRSRDGPLALLRQLIEDKIDGITGHANAILE